MKSPCRGCEKYQACKEPCALIELIINTNVRLYQRELTLPLKLIDKFTEDAFTDLREDRASITVTQKKNIRYLRQAIKLLHLRERQTIILKFWKNMNGTEMAKKLKVNRSSIYRPYHRALNSLRIGLGL